MEGAYAKLVRMQESAEKDERDTKQIAQDAQNGKLKVFKHENTAEEEMHMTEL